MIVVLASVASLPLLQWLRTKYETSTPDLDKSALLFTCLQGKTQSELVESLEREGVSIREVTMLRELEPHYSNYQKKVEVYFELKA